VRKFILINYLLKERFVQMLAFPYRGKVGMGARLLLAFGFYYLSNGQKETAQELHSAS
jgi:hypothetical protein